jgi:hypothetical protein
MSVFKGVTDKYVVGYRVVHKEKQVIWNEPKILQGKITTGLAVSVIKCGKLSYLEGTKFKSPIDCND